MRGSGFAGRPGMRGPGQLGPIVASRATVVGPLCVDKVAEEWW